MFKPDFCRIDNKRQHSAGPASTAVFVIAIVALIGCGIASANDQCKKIDKDAAVARVMSANPDSKVLKVIEEKDDQGCTRLKIRILKDGTVKSVPVNGG